MKTRWQHTLSKIRQSVGLEPLNLLENPTNVIDSSSDMRDTGVRQDKPLGILYVAMARMPERKTDQHRLQSMHKLDSCVVAYGGRITYFTDDSILAEFNDAHSALHCAINIQLEARQWNAKRDRNRRVNFRMGVHVGQYGNGRDDTAVTS